MESWGANPIFRAPHGETLLRLKARSIEGTLGSEGTTATILSPQPIFVRALSTAQALLATAAIICALWGVAELFQGLLGFAVEGRYSHEPFWMTIGLAEDSHKAFRWDRAWWLVLILPAGLFGLSSALDEWVVDLGKTPRERAKDRKYRREHDPTHSKLDIKTRTRRTPAEGKPMSGWKRLWLVLSLLFGVPVFLIQYSEDVSSMAYHTPSPRTAALKDQAFWDALYWEAHSKQPSLDGCILDTVKMRRETYGAGYTVECDRTFVSAAYPAILYALFPALFMWLVGWTLHWVYRGFRPAKAQ